jgi:glycosyltransferase involved in cell wall biosynthesis
MRIAVWHNLPSGGAKRALYDQVRGLIARGHVVEAWCPPTVDQDYLPLSDLIPEHVVPLTMKSPLKSESRFLRVPRLWQKMNPLEWSVRLRLEAMNRHCRECARQIQVQHFDLLFAHCCMFFHTPAIGRFIRLPRILYLQEPNRPFYESSPELPWLAASWTISDLFDLCFVKKTLVRRLKLTGLRIQAREERNNAKAFDQILVNSLFSRESVLRAFGLDSKVCYLGVDTNKFINQNETREAFAICVAALLPPKNIEFLILALAKVPSAMRPRLLLVANMIYEPYLAEIRTLANRTKVELELKPRISDRELIDLLNRARMMLYAPRLEPFGYAPLEANACGLPVVAVAEGGVRETIQDGVNGLLVDHAPEQMAEAVVRLLTDDEMHRRLSENALHIAVTKWSLHSSLDRLEQILACKVETQPVHRISREAYESSVAEPTRVES